MTMVSAGRVVALVPARNEEGSVGETVRSLRSLPISEVVVVDDGSADATAAAALAAGASVIRIPRRAGKGAAMEGALSRLPDADFWLLADADLGSSATGLGTLLDACQRGADLAIAVLPPQEGAGLGSVRRFAAWAIGWLSGLRVTAPLSGQRAITRACLGAVRPLAPGFGVETAMTIDAVRAGFRVEEIRVPGLRHRPTGRGLRGFRHRGRQGTDIARAVLARAPRR
jgi:glycosyltransferase involved in cell wall biosynthesis